MGVYGNDRGYPRRETELDRLEDIDIALMDYVAKCSAVRVPSPPRSLSNSGLASRIEGAL